MLVGSGISEMIKDVCLYYYEKIDGSGYFKGLNSDIMSLYVKMVVVCDVYDVVILNCFYKVGWDLVELIKWMVEWMGYFDLSVF